MVGGEDDGFDWLEILYSFLMLVKWSLYYGEYNEDFFD